MADISTVIKRAATTVVGVGLLGAAYVLFFAGVSNQSKYNNFLTTYSSIAPKHADYDGDGNISKEECNRFNQEVFGPHDITLPEGFPRENPLGVSGDFDNLTSILENYDDSH